MLYLCICSFKSSTLVRECHKNTEKQPQTSQVPATVSIWPMNIGLAMGSFGLGRAWLG